MMPMYTGPDGPETLTLVVLYALEFACVDELAAVTATFLRTFDFGTAILAAGRWCGCSGSGAGRRDG
jgi:hypothetical protein